MEEGTKQIAWQSDSMEHFFFDNASRSSHVQCRILVRSSVCYPRTDWRILSICVTNPACAKHACFLRSVNPCPTAVDMKPVSTLRSSVCVGECVWVCVGGCGCVWLCVRACVCVRVWVTMTHSSEVSNVNQEPGPTEMRAGVMTPRKKNLICLYALLNGQGRLLVLCQRQCTESRVKKRQRSVKTQGHGTNSVQAIFRDSGSWSHPSTPVVESVVSLILSNGFKIMQTCISRSTRCSDSFQWQGPLCRVQQETGQIAFT